MPPTSNSQNQFAPSVSLANLVAERWSLNYAVLGKLGHFGPSVSEHGGVDFPDGSDVGLSRLAALYCTKMTDHQTLLARYASDGSEEAFRELVARYINLVYATALRLMDGDTHRAEDVTQTVFADLARLAGALSRNVMLGGWLHRRTCHVAASLRRSERRRQNRERQAAQMNALQNQRETGFEGMIPLLDDAINHLNPPDRTAILLRFFEGRNLRSVGEVLGTSEDAAQKRVTRALDKLRVLLEHRGVTTSSAVLAATLSAQSALATPSGLAASVSCAALSSAAAGGWSAPLLKLLGMTKLKFAAGIALLAGLGTVLVLEHGQSDQMRREHQVLQQQLDGLTRQSEGGSRPSNPISSAGPQAFLQANPLRELEQLRQEAAALRPLAVELDASQGENDRLRAALGGPQDPAEAKFKSETERRIQDLKRWGLMFRVHLNETGGQWPDGWQQVADQIPAPLRDSFLNFASNNFEIVYHGDEQGFSNRVGAILFREKQARRSPTGQWVKVYGHFDGSASVHALPDANFDAWEQQHMIAPH